jgi:hypothetical protein
MKVNKRRNVGWVERFFAIPNKPKLPKQVLLFRVVGLRDKAANPTYMAA